MRPWFETVGVTLLGLAAASAAYAVGRSGRRRATTGYAAGFLLLAAAAWLRWRHVRLFGPPPSWLAVGREHFAFILCGVAVITGALASRIRAVRLRVLVAVLSVIVAARFGLIPFAEGALIRQGFAEMATVVTDGVCIQRKSHTCGPAAAVTALRTFGLPAEEGQLAIWSHTVPVYGVAPNMLCHALNKHYGRAGLACEIRHMASLAELREAGLTIASVRYSVRANHYVAVLKVTDAEVVAGDPIRGRRRLTWDQFEEMWLHSGIVLRRVGNAAGSAARPPVAPVGRQPER